MQAKSGKKINARTQAMWHIAHLRAMGVEPLPFGNRSYISSRADLQRQHDPVRASLDKDSASLARAAARAAVRAKTLEGIAGDLLPAPADVIANAAAAGRPLLEEVNRGSETEPWTVLDGDEQTSTPRDIAVCKRKLRHTNYLSALLHLVRVGDLGMHAYPCPACFGIHVGHDRDRARLQTVTEQIEEVNSKITKLLSERTRLEEQHSVLVQRQQQLFWEADGDTTRDALPEKY